LFFLPLKVKSYIALLSIGSLVGASLLIGLGWWGFNGLADATRELDEETRRTGESSVEYKDVSAFLDTTRDVFTSLEIFPERYAGLFGVTRDKLALAKKQLNNIAANYSEHYPKEILEPVTRDLSKTERAILKLEEFAFTVKDIKPAQRTLFFKNRYKANIEYETTRDELKRSLEMIEVESEKFRSQSEQELSNKWNSLKEQEDRNSIFLITAVSFYLLLISFLGFSTYKSLASPLRKLEQAAESSIDHNKPFTMVEVGPYEIRSLTRRLQGLIFGLEETVESRTRDLKQRTVQLQTEIQQRKELETQLVHAQKMEAVGQLASGIAHEINSPSQFANDNILFLKDAVDGFIAQIDQTEKAPDEKEILFLKENAPQAVDQAKEGISRITTIVKSMKNFAYRDANSEKKPNDLNQAIRSTSVVATNEWKYHAEMQLNLDKTLPMVPCNIGEINQVILNLIVNGAHAIRDRFEEKQKGTLIVRSQHYPDANCVVISITDNGGGIPEKVQSRIFEPFFTTKDVGVGTGQGLAIAHNVIVKSHGGQIWFESKQGEGTTFYIKLLMTQPS
jgi:signal transduction histidine kinase